MMGESQKMVSLIRKMWEVFDKEMAIKDKKQQLRYFYNFILQNDKQFRDYFYEQFIEKVQKLMK